MQLMCLERGLVSDVQCMCCVTLCVQIDGTIPEAEMLDLGLLPL